MAAETENESLGQEVSTVPAFPPSNQVNLVGKYVTLTALTDGHIDSLWEHLNPLDFASVWTYLALDPPKTLEGMRTTFSRLRRWGFVAFAITGNSQKLSPPSDQSIQTTPQRKEVLGTIGFHDIELDNRALEMGGVIFSPMLQRTAAATEVYYLLLRLAFEGAHSAEPALAPTYRRVAWKCHHANKKSRSAAERVGFKFEGTARNHMIVKGRSRDSDYLGIIDAEWPAIKYGFEAWLADDNFDVHGVQKRRLTEYRQSYGT